MSLHSRLKNYNELEGIAFVLHSSERFAVSKCGMVLGRTGRILKQKSQGFYNIVSYQTVCGKTRHMYVHRMVAEVWVARDIGDEVNHIDGDKLNNRADNLEWVSRKENAIHAKETNLIWNCPKIGQRGFQSAG